MNDPQNIQKYFRTTCVIFLLFVICVQAASANESLEQDEYISKAEVDELMEELKQQKILLEKKEKELEEQKKLLDLKLTELDATLGKAEELIGHHRGAGTAGFSSAYSQDKALRQQIAEKQQTETLAMMSGRGPQEVGTERKTESEKKKPEVPAVAVDSGGVLLPKGRLVLEPLLQYSRTSALRVAIEGFTVIPAINIGLFDISEIDRDIITTAITGRFGLTNRLEIEAYIPYLWREDSTIGRPIGVGTATNVLSNIDGSGLGDVELALHYQINEGKNNWPFFIGNLRYKTTTGTGPFDVPIDPGTGLQTEAPTGSGFHAIQPSITMLYPSDPTVFFMNLGYTYNMKDNVGGGNGEIDPGDSINLGLGMGFSVNDKTSFSLGYSHSVVGETKQNGAAFPNSDTLQVGSTTLGYSYQVNDKVGLNFSLATGVTDDAPDMQATLRVPVKFDLFK